MRNFALSAALLVVPSLSFAHPISQGSLELVRTTDRLQVRARVAVEEIFLTSSAAGLTEAWEEHGRYFLEHFHIDADGRRLEGRVGAIAESGPLYVAYDIDYPLPASTDTLELRQDLLNEISFAPGNRWEATFVVSMRDGGRTLHEGLLLTSQEELSLAGSTTDRSAMFFEYVRHGLRHILGGYDHLLFVSALALSAITFGDLLLLVAAFTLAHSLTLTLSVLGLVRLPSAIVEPMIAASIVIVALVNVLWPRRGRDGARLAVAFFFGLFHGLGFAGGLLEAMSGMAGASVARAILGFSLGVELGHQVVVLPLLGLRRLLQAAGDGEERKQPWSVGMSRYGSAAISLAGAFYLVSALR